MEQLQFLDRPDASRAFSFPYRRKHYSEEEGVAAFGEYWRDESRLANLHKYLHNTKTSKVPLNSDAINLISLYFNIHNVE